jgi:hypothetical protein
MAKQTKRYLFIIFISFIFSLGSNAQETSKRLPLVEVLSFLEIQYNIQFNYAEDAISKIVIAEPSKDLSLSDILIYLSDKTDLEFTLINNNMVLVVSKMNDLKLQKLSEVTVAGYIVKGINKLNDGSFEIDVSDFDILPGLIDTDVLQAVQAFPGVQSINETVSNINIRGGTHDQNLILWDDIKMYQSGHFFGLISMFNPQITQRVSLIKNGSSTEYTDGVSGTISMETNRDINDKF